MFVRQSLNMIRSRKAKCVSTYKFNDTTFTPNTICDIKNVYFVFNFNLKPAIIMYMVWYGYLIFT